MPSEAAELNVSFEFFPPRSMQASFDLWDSVHSLASFNPSFVSVTHGAGGSSNSLTREAVEVIAKNSDLNVAAHLTCVGASRSELVEAANTYSKCGVREIVALRGDAPKERVFSAESDGCASVVELIELLALMGPYHIRVAAYPERHPDAISDDADIDWLKRKFDAGAESAITQFFFEAETFLRFRDRCEKAGITQPIIPGVLPVKDWSQARRFAERAGVGVPHHVEAAYRNAKKQGCAELLSVSLTSELCSDLIDEGVRDIHFFTLNSPHLTRRVCWALGVPEQMAVTIAA